MSTPSFPRRARQSAFTLVELAIVISILGLLVGGVLAGRSLVQAQQVRGVLVDATTYALATQQFVDKYGAPPGDMADAERVWGNAEGGDVNTNCATPLQSASVGTATCNGSGDGVITYLWESYRAWQQLSAAGYIGGSYSGIHAGGPSADIGQHMPGWNIPASGVAPGAGFAFVSWGLYTSDSIQVFAGSYDNSIWFGAVVNGSAPYWPVLTAADAAGIDAKADDGMPAYGNIRSFAGGYNAGYLGVPACVSAGSGASAAYLTNTNGHCALIFMNTFKQRQN